MATILHWPMAIPAQVSDAIPSAHTSAFESPISRTLQTTELPGSQYRVSVTLPPMREAQRAELRAFLARLRGRSGRFYLPVCFCCTVPGHMLPEPTVYAPLTVDTEQITLDSTAVTVDQTLITQGAQLAVAAVVDRVTLRCADAGAAFQDLAAPLRAGSRISYDTPYGRHLHILVADPVRGPAGVLLEIEPPMEYLPTAGTPVHTRCPSMTARLASDDEGQAMRMPGRYFDTAQIECVSATVGGIPL